MSNPVYEASVFTQTVNYVDLKGNTKTVELFFALDPIQLLRVFAGFPMSKPSRSKNPAKQAQDAAVTEETQLKMLVELASKAAGFPSDDGETWEPFENFENQIAGKTFITLLASSDTVREEFAKSVLLDPFKAFVRFAEADASNTPAEIQQLNTMLEQAERIFAVADKTETLEDRRARLAREMEELDKQQGDN